MQFGGNQRQGSKIGSNPKAQWLGAGNMDICDVMRSDLPAVARVEQRAPRISIIQL